MKYIFVCGAPRSGTTLLTRVLGSNDKVVLGVERFKGLLNSDHFDRDLFNKNRFFDFREGDTNVRYEANKAYYDNALNKFEAASYVGDKIPNLYKRIVNINERFGGDATFVFCYRNIYEVAASWNARAMNTNDKWPEENNYIKAVVAWMESFKYALRAKKEGVRIIPFNYNALIDSGFDAGLKYYSEFLIGLDLGLCNDDASSLNSEFTKYPEIRNKRIVLSPEQISHIDSNIDISVLIKFMRAFRVGRVGMPELVQAEWARIISERKILAATKDK